MKLLSIDSSGKSAACAVTDGEKVLAESFINSGLTHSQTLLPMVDKMLSDAGIKISEIDAFAVTNGPGSFTGLRIGMALVMGLSGDKKCIAVPTLKALAYNMAGVDGIIVPVMDARRNQVYTSLFESKGGKLTQLEEDSAIPVDEVIERLKKYAGQKIWVLGDGAYLFEGKSELISFPENDILFIKGPSIALAAKEYEPIDAQDLKINYLRLSQAERELKEKQSGGKI